MAILDPSMAFKRWGEISPPLRSIREYLGLFLLALYFYLFALELVYLYTLTLSIIFKSLS